MSLLDDQIFEGLLLDHVHFSSHLQYSQNFLLIFINVDLIFLIFETVFYEIILLMLHNLKLPHEYQTKINRF